MPTSAPSPQPEIMAEIATKWRPEPIDELGLGFVGNVDRGDRRSSMRRAARRARRPTRWHRASSGSRSARDTRDAFRAPMPSTFALHGVLRPNRRWLCMPRVDFDQFDSRRRRAGAVAQRDDECLAGVIRAEDRKQERREDRDDAEARRADREHRARDVSPNRAGRCRRSRPSAATFRRNTARRRNRFGFEFAAQGEEHEAVTDDEAGNPKNEKKISSAGANVPRKSSRSLVGDRAV